MSSHIIDAIAAGSTPADITQEIKDVLFGKSAERIDDFRQVVAARLFTGSEDTDEVGEEEE